MSKQVLYNKPPTVSKDGPFVILLTKKPIGVSVCIRAVIKWINKHVNHGQVLVLHEWQKKGFVYSILKHSQAKWVISKTMSCFYRNFN